MANRISSAEEAISALIKLKQRSVPVRVNISFPHMAFSFEGAVLRVDDSGLEIRDANGTLFRLAAIPKFDFFGELNEMEGATSFTMTIVPKGQGDSPEAVRVFLTAQWPPIPWVTVSSAIQ